LKIKKKLVLYYGPEGEKLNPVKEVGREADFGSTFW
jgi:hypothetical protein